MTTEIAVDVSPTSDLKWENISVSDEKILWNLDLNLSTLPIPPWKQGEFQALRFSIEEFAERLVQPNIEQTEGVVFFEGSADFTTDLSWTAPLEADYREWRKGKEDVPFLRRKFARDLVVDLFELLASPIHPSVPLLLRLDACSLKTPFDRVEAVNQERFQYFSLEVVGGVELDPMAPTGILLPSQEDFHQGTAEVISGLIGRLQKKGEPFRVIPENRLTLEWHQLNSLFVVRDAVSFQGDRKLQGFKAAGGELIFL
jgi:hypothetical protein